MSNPYTFLQDLDKFPLRHTLGSHRFKHQEGWVSGVTWHPDGKSFFTIHDRTRILQTSVETGEPVGEVVVVSWWVDHLAVSPDGETWLLTGMMGEVARYECKIKRLTLLRQKPSAYTSSSQRGGSAFSPSGSVGITIGRHGGAIVGFLREKQLKPNLPDDLRAPFIFSSDGLWFASCASNFLRVYSVETRQLVKEFALPKGEIVTLRFSPDGKRLIAANREQQIFLCDVEDGSLKSYEKRDIDIYAKPGCVMIQDEQRAYVASAYGVLFSLDLQGGAHRKLTQVWLDSQASSTEAFSPDGKWMLGMRGRAFYLFDLTKESFVDLHDGHSDQINGVSSSPDGKRAALADNDGLLRIWSTETGEREWMLEQIVAENQRRESLLDVAYHPAGHEIYAIQYWNKIRRWELSSGLESPLSPSYHASITPNDQYPTTFALSTFTLGPDGDLALISGPESSSDYSSENASYRVLLYSLSQMKVLWVHTDKLSRFSTYTFSPDGSLVLQVISSKEARSAVGGIDFLARETPQDHAGQGRIFSVKDGSIIRSFRGPRGEPLRVGRLLTQDRVIAAMRGGLAIWPLSKPAEARYFDAPDGATKPLALSDDEALLAAADEKGGVGLWEIKTGALVERIPLERTHDRATCMTFCRGTHRLVIGTAKGVGLIFG
jgi:WD40 repeat protein